MNNYPLIPRHELQPLIQQWYDNDMAYLRNPDGVAHTYLMNQAAKADPEISDALRQAAGNVANTVSDIYNLRSQAFGMYLRNPAMILAIPGYLQSCTQRGPVALNFLNELTPLLKQFPVPAEAEKQADLLKQQIIATLAMLEPIKVLCNQYPAQQWHSLLKRLQYDCKILNTSAPGGFSFRRTDNDDDAWPITSLHTNLVAIETTISSEINEIVEGLEAGNLPNAPSAILALTKSLEPKVEVARACLEQMQRQEGINPGDAERLKTIQEQLEDIMVTKKATESLFGWAQGTIKPLTTRIASM